MSLVIVERGSLCRKGGEEVFVASSQRFMLPAERCNRDLMLVDIGFVLGDAVVIVLRDSKWHSDGGLDGEGNFNADEFLRWMRKAVQMTSKTH